MGDLQLILCQSLLQFRLSLCCGWVEVVTTNLNHELPCVSLWNWMSLLEWLVHCKYPVDSFQTQHLWQKYLTRCQSSLMNFCQVQPKLFLQSWLSQPATQPIKEEGNSRLPSHYSRLLKDCFKTKQEQKTRTKTMTTTNLSY